MTEIFIKKEQEGKKIALVENGILTEYYEENEEDNGREGNIYIGIVRNIIKGMQSAFVDIGTEKNSFIHLKDVLPKVDEKKEKKEDEIKDISKILKPNQKIIVQVKKDSNEQKGARVSTHINLPGKYIVLLPGTDIITVSQKIEDKKEQERLIKIVQENISENNGAIIRTSSKGKEKEIIKEIKSLENKWNKICEKEVDVNSKKPELIYKSEDIAKKMLIDLSTKGISNIYTNSQEEYNEIKEILQENEEYKNIKLQLGGKDILEKYNLKNQIEKSKNRKIWLKCGGFITIDKTEALTAIDVNTGKYIGGANKVEQTIYKVNMEATIEIAKQLRLKDIGGIIIIDYIDMLNKEDKEKIEELLKKELKKDRTKTQVEGFTKLDLMELTRKHICSHKE